MLTRYTQTLPTYDFLAQAGITPSTSTTYSLSTLTDALKNATGVTPALNCAGSSLSSIQWYFNLKGSLIDDEFVAISAPRLVSSEKRHLTVLL